MGAVHRWLYKCVYPLPQKGEDILLYKQNFINEYTYLSQLKTEMTVYLLACFFFFTNKRKHYVKKVKDAEQKSRFEAHKICHQILSRLK